MVEGLSIDEAFLDVRGLTTSRGRRSRSPRGYAGGSARRSVCRSRSASRARSSWPRWRARVAKPDGLLVVAPDRELEFLHPLPVERLWGVGRVTAEKLHERGITTVGQVALLAERDAGRDARPRVRPPPPRAGAQLRPAAGEVRRRRRSIGAQRALGRRRALAGGTGDASLLALVDRVRGGCARPGGCAGRWSCGCASRTSRARRALTRCARRPSRPHTLLADRARAAPASRPIIERRGLTLIGITLTNLTDVGAVQLVLPFDRAREPRRGGRRGARPVRLEGDHARRAGRPRPGDLGAAAAGLGSTGPGSRTLAIHSRVRQVQRHRPISRHPPRHAQTLEQLHRLPGCSGSASSAPAATRRSPIVTSRRLEREPAEPPDRGTLVAARVAAAQHEADPQRVVQRHLGQLARGRHDKRLVAGLERPAEAGRRDSRRWSRRTHVRMIAGG